MVDEVRRVGRDARAEAGTWRPRRAWPGRGPRGPGPGPRGAQPGPGPRRGPGRGSGPICTARALTWNVQIHFVIETKLNQ